MEAIQFSSGNQRFGRYLRNVGRKEDVDIRLARLYNVATIISAKTFITSVRDNSKYYCLFLKCTQLIVNSVFLRSCNMNDTYIMYQNMPFKTRIHQNMPFKTRIHQNMPFKTRKHQNMPKCPKRSKYAFICKIKTDYLLLERLSWCLN
jgi:hypothetical protein